MATTQVEIPGEVLARMKIINTSRQIPMEEIQAQYAEIFNDDFIQKDPQFSTVEEKHRFAVMVLWNQLINRPPATAYDVVPIGFDGTREPRGGGTPYCNLYILLAGELKIRRIMCRGAVSDVYNRINLFYMYKDVQLGQFQEGGDFIADERAKFKNPIRLKGTPAELMAKLRVKEVTVAEVERFPSATRASDGYTDQCDWRKIRGMISRANIFTRKDGTEGGVINLMDWGSTDEVPVEDDEGRLQTRTLTCWTDPAHMIYMENDIVDVYGTCGFNRKGEFTWNSLLLLPVVQRPRAGDD